MNILLWVVQVLLALHTVTGAVWKVSHSEQAVPSLAAIPHGLWMGLIAVELLCSVGLVVPAVSSTLGLLAPAAAVCIAAEMLFFTAVHFGSGDSNLGPVVYWLVVAGVCAFIAYGRFVARPL